MKESGKRQMIKEKQRNIANKREKERERVYSQGEKKPEFRPQP